MVLIHIAWILALAVILWPLFTIAKYDYPSADDWSFGKYMYRAMQAGEGITGVFHAIYQTLAQNVWEARFSILILSALQPAAFGEHFYRITPYLMIGSVILSQFLLLRECIAGQAKENRWLILPIGIPMAILQVLYCPYPEESFYWYNGSVNYTFVYSLSLVLLIPFFWKAVRKMSYEFHFPGLFTALTFGVYASQATATIYVDGTMGGGRQGAILWYFYVLWMVANVLYWCGWIAKRDAIAAKAEKADQLAGKYLLRYSTAAGVLLAAAVLFGNVQSTTSYRAYRMWKNGWAQAYGAGWEERLKVLKDDSVKNPVFTPLNYVELIMYTDLQPEGGYVWVNSACAEYYGKESVTVVEGE